MTDQWIISTSGMRAVADTSMVYEPIFEKYGYTKLDYINSVDFYMNDPERFSRILRTCIEKLDKRIAVLEKIKKQQDQETELSKFIDRFMQYYSFEDIFPYLSDEPYVHYYDSLTFVADTTMIYRLVPVEKADTLANVDTLSKPEPPKIIKESFNRVKLGNPEIKNELWQLRK